MTFGKKAFTSSTDSSENSEKIKADYNEELSKHFDSFHKTVILRLPKKPHFVSMYSSNSKLVAEYFQDFGKIFGDWIMKEPLTYPVGKTTLEELAYYTTAEHGDVSVNPDWKLYGNHHLPVWENRDYVGLDIERKELKLGLSNCSYPGIYYVWEQFFYLQVLGILDRKLAYQMNPDIKARYDNSI